MQKKIIALAIAAAFAAPAAAMADVTVYGSMDGGLRHQINDYKAVDSMGRPSGTTDSMKMGQYNTARWGFKVAEDMGNGMKTNVVLETSLAPGGVGANPDMTAGNADGYPNAGMNMSNPFGLIFDRQATIGLEGGLGKFDMGWNYSTSFKTICAYDAYSCKFLGVTGAPSSAASLRNGGMQLGTKFGDVAVSVEYIMNDSFQDRQRSFASTGRAVGVSYAANGLNVGAAYTAKEDIMMNAATGAPTGYDNSMTHVTAGGGYNFGDGKVSVGYAKKTTQTNPATTANDNTDTNMWLGGSFNVSSAVALTAAYYSNAKNTGAANAVDSTKKTMMLGGTYNLSKKTQVYLGLDRATANSGAANAEDFVTVGTSAGLSTVF